MSDVTIIKLKYDCIINCFEMFKSRQYTISEDAQKFIDNINLNDYNKLFNNKKIGLPIDNSVLTNDNPPYKVVIEFCNEAIENKQHDILKVQFGLTSSNNNDKIIELKKLIEKNKNHYIIIFLSNDITSEKIDKFYELNVPHIEYFGIKQLSLNIMKHKYQPKFEIIPKPTEEKKLQQYKELCKDSAKICYNDPAVRYFNAPVDTLFKITRDSQMAISTSYRIVKNIKMNEVKSKISKNYADVETSYAGEDD